MNLVANSFKITCSLLIIIQQSLYIHYLDSDGAADVEGYVIVIEECDRVVNKIEEYGEMDDISVHSATAMKSPVTIATHGTCKHT